MRHTPSGQSLVGEFIGLIKTVTDKEKSHLFSWNTVKNTVQSFLSGILQMDTFKDGHLNRTQVITGWIPLARPY